MEELDKRLYNNIEEYAGVNFMLKVKAPKNLYLKGGERAVLLLHSFTGTVQDVKEVAENLNEEGFTCYAPCYTGHGLPVSEFVKYDIHDWWKDVEASYRFLQAEGYREIDAIGVSLGGIFSLKLAEEFKIGRVVGMSIPYEKREKGVIERLNTYGERLQHYILCTDDEQVEEMAHVRNYINGADRFESFTDKTMNELEHITAPTLLMYGGQDEISYRESAIKIENGLTNVNDIEVECFENAGHLMTRRKDKSAIIERIIDFLCK